MISSSFGCTTLLASLSHLKGTRNGSKSQTNSQSYDGGKIWWPTVMDTTQTRRRVPVPGRPLDVWSETCGGCSPGSGYPCSRSGCLRHRWMILVWSIVVYWCSLLILLVIVGVTTSATIINHGLPLFTWDRFINRHYLRYHYAPILTINHHQPS